MTPGMRAATARGRPLAGSPAGIAAAVVLAALAGCASAPEAPASPPPPPQPVVLAPAPPAPAPAAPDRVLTPESGTPLPRPGSAAGSAPSADAQVSAPLGARPSGTAKPAVAAPSGAGPAAVAPSGTSPAAGATAAAPAPGAPMGAPGGLGIAAGGASASASQAVIRLVAEPGLYRCELNRRVTLRRVAADGRSVVLNWLGKDHTLDAVQARTGALRFENPSSGLMWLVIVGKSMLLDTRRGQQLANECKL